MGTLNDWFSIADKQYIDVVRHQFSDAVLKPHGIVDHIFTEQAALPRRIANHGVADEKYVAL